MVPALKVLALCTPCVVVLVHVSLGKFLHQVRSMDIGGKLSSAFFGAIVFPVHQVVQAAIGIHWDLIVLLSTSMKSQQVVFELM